MVGMDSSGDGYMDYREFLRNMIEEDRQTVHGPLPSPTHECYGHSPMWTVSHRCYGHSRMWTVSRRCYGHSPLWTVSHRCYGHSCMWTVSHRRMRGPLPRPTHDCSLLLPLSFTQYPP